MLYEVYTVTEDSDREYGPKIGDVRVRFSETGDDYCTEVDEQGQRYFSIPNTINPNHTKNCFERLFSGRIRDAYEAIVRGDGDCIGNTQMFGPLGFRNENVIKFVDTVYGDTLRTKTLEGWKDTQFGYNVVFGYNNSFSGARPVCNNDTLFSPFCDKSNEIYFFETEDEAQNYMDSVMEKVKPIVEEYNSLVTDEQKEEFFKRQFPTREDHLTIVAELFYAMAKDSSEEEEKKFTFKTKQAVKIK